MKINLLKISGLSVLFLLQNPAFSKDSAWASARKPLTNEALRLKIQTQRNLTGTVVDDKNVPITGVVVRNITTGASVATDVNGRFSIEAGTDNTLTFSFIGFVTQTRKVGAQSNLTIKLVSSNTSLTEVVVVGYGTQTKPELTSATSTVKPEDFRQSGSRSPLDLIQGKVPGLNITRIGGSNPNGTVSVQLRGAVTVTGSASPLIVIDGIPGGNLNLLQQDDIASIDVLKDGSGAAIYGTSANAGVILITTKKGKPGPPQFNYSSYFRKEYFQKFLNFLTPDEFRQRIASGDIKQKDFGSSTDFYDQLINHKNFSQNHNFALSGGTNKTSYRASLNYRDLQGIGKANEGEDYALRLSINQTGLNDRLKMQVDVATDFSKLNLLGSGGILFNATGYSGLNNGSWESEATKNPTLSNFNPDGTYRFDLISNNEYARLFQETNYRKQQVTSADAKADLTIVKGLTATAFGSVIRNSYVDGQYRLKASENSLENTSFPGGGYAYRERYFFRSGFCI